MLIAGEGGSVLVHASAATDAVALACEGLATPTTVPSGVPVYPADAIPDDLAVERVELLPCESATRDAVVAWARGREVVDVEIGRMRADVRVVAVSACSTGSGKTALSRRVARSLMRKGKRVAVVRNPIANLLCWGRFDVSVVRTPPELLADRPIEEREELAPLVGAGIACATGLDPESLLRTASRDADVIVWDGGGAAAPWIEPDLHLVAVDLLRDVPIDARIASADAVVLTKADSAPPDRARAIERRVREMRPDIPVLLADLTIGVQDGAALRDRRVVIVEDWPSLVLGGLAAGAGAVAARRFRCGVIDPRPFAVGAVREELVRHPHIGAVIPSLGRTPAEIADFAASVRATPADVVLWASNADPAGVVPDEPRQMVRAFGELTEVAGPSLQELL